MSKKLKPVHPGVYLRELMGDYGLTAAKLARHIGVAPMRISFVLNGKRPLTAELALRLEKAFGITAGYWLNLEMQYELAVAADSATAKDLNNIGAIAVAA
jgi:addiction module HigA family antidote